VRCKATPRHTGVALGINGGPLSLHFATAPFSATPALGREGGTARRVSPLEATSRGFAIDLVWFERAI